MSKSASKNKEKTTKPAVPVTTGEEINSYDEQVNKRIDPKQPDGGKVESVDVVVDETIMALNPEMKEQGIKVGDTIQVDKNSSTPYEPTEDELKALGSIVSNQSNAENRPDEDQLSDDALGVLADYVKAYPDNDVFHITSDGQVFLDRNKSDAINHEKTLGGHLKSYTV